MAEPAVRRPYIPVTSERLVVTADWNIPGRSEILPRGTILSVSHIRIRHGDMPDEAFLKLSVRKESPDPSVHSIKMFYIKVDAFNNAPLASAGPPQR